jgi:hypothetical protein
MIVNIILNYFHSFKEEAIQVLLDKCYILSCIALKDK